MSVMQRSTVLLRHDLPDGSRHFDWLLDLAGDGEAALTTFRLPRPVCELQQGETMPAERVADHRRRYLEYEGPISGGRGDVSRIAVGEITQYASADRSWRLDLCWQHPTVLDQQLDVQCSGELKLIPQKWVVFCIAYSASMS